MTFQLLSFLKKNLYLLIIFFILILTINSYDFFYLELIFYVTLHILFIFYSFYDDFKINYFIVFLLGFVLDLFLINDFGPHLLVFMFFYLLINKIKRFFINQKQLILITINLLFVILILFTEKILIFIIYGSSFSYYILLQSIIISAVLYYPIYLILNMIKMKM